MRARRPLHALTAAGAAAHHAFELAAGVGLVFQPDLGLAGASAFWAVTLPGWFGLAVRPGRAPERLLAFLAGMSAAAGAVHYVLWPVRIRGGLPWLVEAEGLRPQHLPAYNAVLYLWTLSAVTAVAVETPPSERRWAVPGALTAALLSAGVRRHFRWVREQARTHPAWWNRALAEAAG
ncbi:MAG TPA: hypothetical protein VKA30_02170 [Actinomycetota bacterium]|nr:hypothetical protein [Actinomycetota bacterium]